MSTSGNPLGPLPNFDANARLQELSIKALHALLKGTDDLVLRDERVNDLGVDASIEVIIDGRATNFRAQVQLKAVNRLRPNRDGTFSRSIEVYNVNYLLNGTSPLYFLYIADQDRFLYTWVKDERQRLDRDFGNWQSQGSVVVHFSRTLDTEAFRDIRDRILREEQFRRQLNNTLACHALAEDVQIRIDRATLSTISSDAAYRDLTGAGLSLISNGYASEVLALFDLLTPLQKAEPRMQAVAAYALFNRGNFQKALGHIGDAQARSDELSIDDYEMLEGLRNACECQVGLIDRAEYQRRQTLAAQTARGSARVSYELEARRFEFLAERDADRRAEKLGLLRALVSSLQSDPVACEAVRLQARIYLAYSEGTELSLAVTHQMGLLAIRISLSQEWAEPDPSELHSAIRRLQDWEGEARLLEDTEVLGVPVLHAEALRTFLVVRLAYLGSLRFQDRFLRMGTGLDQSVLEEAKQQAMTAVEAFHRADHLEGELRTRMTLAHIHELNDDIGAAKGVARAVLPIARALGLAEIVREASGYLNDETLLQRTERSMKLRQEQDQDVLLAQMVEGDIERFAKGALEASRLPVSRLPVISRDVAAMRSIARERLGWCRHIQQIQNKFHTFHVVTAYASDPERFCRCELHKYESLQGSTDPEMVIERFKRAYCADCSDRRPKGVDPIVPNAR